MHTRTVLLVLAIIVSGAVAPKICAQELSFEGGVDQTRIGVNQDLTLQLTVSGSDLDNVPEPELPAMPEFRVVGRTSSTSSNISIINGKITSSRTIKYIYRLHPQSTGMFTINGATIVYDGRTYRTDPISIRVSDATKPGAGSPSNRMPGGQAGSRAEADLGDDLFIQATVNKRRAYIGEQVTVTYKLFTNVNLSNVQYDRLPSYTGFLAEEVYTAQRLNYDSEVLNGKRYNTVVIKRVALFPSIAGNHELAPYSVICYVPTRRRRSLLDSFFDDPLTGSFDSIFSRSQPFTLKTLPVSLEVRPLSEADRPSDFSGGVGTFSLKGEIDTVEPGVSQPLTLTVTLSGQGNIKTVNEPVMPELVAFKRYATSSTQDLGHSAGRVSGKRVYNHVLIPLQSGDVQIPPVTFTYFDPQKASYQTARTAPIALNIKEGSGGESTGAYTTPKEDVLQVTQDIQHIKPSGLALIQQGGLLVNSPWFLLLNVLPAAGLLGALLYRSHSSRLAQDEGYARWRRAHSETRRALKRAESAHKSGNLDESFRHMASALHQYVGNKFNVSVAGLTSPQIVDLLREKGIATETIQSLQHCLEACDIARFASTTLTAGSTKEVLETAKKVIADLEQRLIKRS